MDVENKAVSLERSPESSIGQRPAKQDSSPILEGQTLPRKRPFRERSTGFTKAVIICNSSELTKSEANTYRPNNIVIELLKKNPLRYGKFTFQKFTSEKEIREELSLRFAILKNKKFWFASADQFGKLNFRDLEEWSGRNLRRWLPGSSAMYIILENSRDGNENEAKDKSPYSGISCTTLRAGTSTTGPVSWHANNSQRALLDFLSSSDKSKLCNTQKVKVFAMDARQKESNLAENQSSKAPAHLDLRSLAMHTKNEPIDVDSESRVSGRHVCYTRENSQPSLGTMFPSKRRRMLHTCQSEPCFARLTKNKPFPSDRNLGLEHQIFERDQVKDVSGFAQDVSVVAQSSHENNKAVSRTYENSQNKPNTFSSKERFIAKDSTFGPRVNSRESLQNMDEKKDSTPPSHQESVQRIPNDPNASRVPRVFQPYYLMSDPHAVFGRRSPSEEQKEIEENVASGHEMSSASPPVISPLQAIYLPSTGFFPWGQMSQGKSNAAHLQDKGPSLAFVPFEVLPYPVSGGMMPYGFLSTNADRGEATRHKVPDWTKMDQRNNRELDRRGEKEDQQISEARQEEPSLTAQTNVPMETSSFGANNSKKLDHEDLVQRFLQISEMEEKMKEGKSIKQNCELFPSSGPCKGGQSFIVVFNPSIDEQFNHSTFCANFNDTSLVKLTRVDRSTFKGKAVPESPEPGHVTVRIEADDQPIGYTCFKYEDGFVDGLTSVVFSGQHGEMMLRFMTSSDDERQQMQAELIDWLEVLVYISAERGSTSTIDKIFRSRYGEAVKIRCSTRNIQPYGCAEPARIPKHISIRNDIENRKSTNVKEEIGHVESAATNDFEREIVPYSPSDSNESAHEQDGDESRDVSPGHEDRTENLMLLSAIASRMGADASTSNESKSSSRNSPPLQEHSNGTIPTTNPSREEDCENSQEHACPRNGFLKKVFVLPANSRYLPSQSELCKLRGSRSSYCKVVFSAEMNENDVYEQIRMAFDDLVGFSFRLAVVDQTGKLVFYDGFWTGKFQTSSAEASYGITLRQRFRPQRRYPGMIYKLIRKLGRGLKGEIMKKKRHKKAQERRKSRSRVEDFASHPDLSINDFADAIEPKQMSKKITKALIKPQPKEYESLKEKQDDLLWYERDDLDLDPNSTSTEEDNDSADERLEGKKKNIKELEYNQDKKKEKAKRKKANESKSFSGELIYPLDLWCLLSKFICPEDVLQFSLICKGAFQAVSFSAFWLRLYSIYVHEPEKLPEHLQPSRIDCGTGLRTRVVRALFQQYGELKNRLVTVAGDSSCMDSLLFHWCSSVWFCQKMKKDTKIWIFYFKFSEKARAQHTKPRRFSKKWFSTVDFVRDNPDEDYTILSVCCLNFISFRPVMGMVLTEALVCISQDMKHCRVKLMFHSHRKDKRYQPESGYQVILDPVQDVRVLKWWHPLYPT